MIEGSTIQDIPIGLQARWECPEWSNPRSYPVPSLVLPAHRNHNRRVVRDYQTPSRGGVGAG